MTREEKLLQRFAIDALPCGTEAAEICLVLECGHFAYVDVENSWTRLLRYKVSTGRSAVDSLNAASFKAALRNMGHCKCTRCAAIPHPVTNPDPYFAAREKRN